MILLRDILSHPLFSAFRIVSGTNGMNTPVTQAGFFDWESDEEIGKYFAKGEFVVTTLAATRNDPGRAEESLRLLIRSQVAAIAIKEVYFHEISEGLRAMSEEWNVPILFFEDTYVDDVLYQVKAMLLQADSGRNSRLLRSLLTGHGLTPEACRETALQLSPFFGGQVLLCAFVTEAVPGQDLTAPAFDSYGSLCGRGSGSGAIPENELQYALFPFWRGVFFVCTANERQSLPEARQLPLLRSFFPDCGPSYRVGLCAEEAGLGQLDLCLKQAFYAALSAVADEIPVLRFSETGPDRFLLPLGDGVWAERYHDGLLEALSRDGGRAEPLLETLEAYVRCGGDIALTAGLLYQHSNTVRYRLQKLRRAWQTEDELRFQTQVCLFCRLHRLLPLLREALEEQ